MKQLKVTLDIILRDTALQEAREDDGLTEEEILREIEKHILEAIGHKYIEDCIVTSIGVS